jgi:hypothetical protein
MPLSYHEIHLSSMLTEVYEGSPRNYRYTVLRTVFPLQYPFTAISGFFVDGNRER